MRIFLPPSLIQRYFFSTIQVKHSSFSNLFTLKIGQAFTAYDPLQLQTNEEITTMLDILLNFLNEKHKISMRDKMFFIGSGYGGNIASCFCKLLEFLYLIFLIVSYNQNINTNIKSVLIINSFLRVEKDIETAVVDWIDTLKGLPNDIPEIHFNHYFVMALNQQGVQMIKDENFMKFKMEMNPIKIEGKIFILRGMLDSLDISNNFRRLDLNVYAVHSLNNCIFRSNNAELFMEVLPEEETEKKHLRTKKGIRKLLYYEGGHDIATVIYLF